MQPHFAAVFLKVAGDPQLTMKKYAEYESFEDWQRRQINEARGVAAATAVTAVLPPPWTLLYIPAGTASVLFLYRKMAQTAWAQGHELGAEVVPDLDLFAITKLWTADVRATAGDWAAKVAPVRKVMRVRPARLDGKTVIVFGLGGADGGVDLGQVTVEELRQLGGQLHSTLISYQALPAVGAVVNFAACGPAVKSFGSCAERYYQAKLTGDSGLAAA